MNIPQVLKPVKNSRLESLIHHATQIVDLGYWILEDIVKKLSFVSNKALLYSAIATLIMGSFYKYLRAFPGFGWIENKNYLLLAPVCIFLPYYLLKNKLLKLDALFLLSVFTFSLSFIIAGSLTFFKDQLILVAAYLMPIPAYFLFRYVNISEKQIVNSLLCFVVISSLLILSEFILTNYLGSSFFLLAFHNFLSDSKGLDIDTKMARNIPFLGRALGILGNAGSPYATAGLFSALLLYGVALYRYRPLFRKKAACIILLSFVSFYLCGSKTAYMVAVAMLGIFYFGFNPIIVIGMFAIGLGLMLFYVFSMGGVEDAMAVFEGITLKPLVYFGNAFVQTEPTYWFYLLFGQGSESSLHHAEFQSELDWLDQFIIVGFFNYALLIAILLTYVQLVLKMEKEKRAIYLPGLLFVATLILGSLHYEALFKYPSNIIVTALMGFAAHALAQETRKSSR